MGTLVYSMQVSTDGFIEDADGDIGFAEPAEDVHRAANQDAREAAAFLYGRRMFEVMDDFWTTAATRDDASEVEAEFAAAYVATPRYVFSDTLDDVPDGVTLVRRADTRETVQRLIREHDGRLLVAGADLARSVLDLVEEFSPYVMPVAVGGGTPFWPPGERLDLRLVDEQRFDSGAVRLRWVRAG